MPKPKTSKVKPVKCWVPLDENGQMVIGDIEKHRSAAQLWADLGNTKQAKVIRILITPLPK